jgi:hypothetical protein
MYREALKIAYSFNETDLQQEMAQFMKDEF